MPHINVYSYTLGYTNRESNKIVHQILTTRGINSRVLIEGKRQKYTTLGHIGLFDFDGISKQYILDNCMNLDGINILWESSKTGYHLWNLSVRSIDDIAILGLKLGSDCKHVAHGYRVGKWVLRIVPKFRKTVINGVVHDEKYKPAPKLIHTWCNDSIRSQSKAHFDVFVALTGKTILHKDSYKFEGLTGEIEDYMTMTDTMKKGI